MVSWSRHAESMNSRCVRPSGPERADAAHDVAGAALRDGWIGHGALLGTGGFGDQLHGQVSQHAADDESCRWVPGAPASVLKGPARGRRLTASPNARAARVVLVPWMVKSNASRRERLDGAGGATAGPAVFTGFTTPV